MQVAQPAARYDRDTNRIRPTSPILPKSERGLVLRILLSCKPSIITEQNPNSPNKLRFTPARHFSGRSLFNRFRTVACQNDASGGRYEHQTRQHKIVERRTYWE